MPGQARDQATLRGSNDKRYLTAAGSEVGRGPTENRKTENEDVPIVATVVVTFYR